MNYETMTKEQLMAEGKKIGAALKAKESGFRPGQTYQIDAKGDLVLKESPANSEGQKVQVRESAVTGLAELLRCSPETARKSLETYRWSGR